jgi:hypothetical protein
MIYLINSKNDGARFLAFEQCWIWCAKPEEFASGLFVDKPVVKARQTEGAHFRK